MSGIGNYLYNLFAAVQPTASDSPSHDEPMIRRKLAQFHRDISPEEEEILPESPNYQPLVLDVLRVKKCLSKVGTYPLPLEVVDAIIDFAEYWPCTTTQTSEGRKRIQGGSDVTENVLILRSSPVGFINPTISPDFTHYQAYPPQTESKSSTPDLMPQLLEEWEKRTIARGAHCRKIVFELRSHDQGWGGSDKGKYDSSYTWFDVGLERMCAYKRDSSTPSVDKNPKNKQHEAFSQFKSPGFDAKGEVILDLQTLFPTTQPNENNGTPAVIFRHPLLPSDMVLQKNKTATRESQENKIEWRYDDTMDAKSAEGQSLKDIGRGPATLNGEFVRGLKPGDVITLWAKARFPGWVNVVELASIKVYWAV